MSSVSSISSVSIICERRTRSVTSESVHIYEQDVARRWFSLLPGEMLPLHTGRRYQLVYGGHSGGSAGPDVRDAVFYAEDHTLIGDVEFHIRSSDWSVHQHHTDPRYNNVILHVVLICDDPLPTLRQDGVAISLCSLQDLSPVSTFFPTAQWPCQRIVPSMSEAERQRVLQRAGLLRFEQKAERFVEQIRAAHEAYEAHGAYDTCLLVALAEALGYGRDRAFFRAVGQRVLGLKTQLPEPLGRSPEPAPLDTQRLRFFRSLLDAWCGWDTFRKLIAHDNNDGIDSLRSLFCDLGLSLARTDILVCNVILPFAAAVALIEHDEPLGERAKALYLLHPGLTSNSITRLMCRQLLLPREPRGSCQQQGLQHIYQETCKEKRCASCTMGRASL